ncbi:MAG TPA: serine/threonine-protein kinase [Kribbella sp.]|nr:serine/threonine-protein kinase [Kribbella sp.]
MDQPPRIGRYSLVRRVGAGGFATVWLAYDEQLDAEVAVKILSDLWIDEEDVRRRFLAEGRFLRRVDSPYVVGVHDVGETEDGRPYLVLTYADGGSLADRIKAGPLEVGKVVDVVSQAGRGLQQLHNHGVLHRDVKPANVLFRSDPPGERAMLGDLGLGKSLEAVSQLTMPGGTPAYVAPEQVMGEQLDQRADLYSLGAVAYAAFTGQAPHGVVTLGAVMRIDAPPPLMTSLRPEIPAAIDAVVRRALEPDRERRWPDLSGFLTALRVAHETGELPPGLEPSEARPTGGTATGGIGEQPTALSDSSMATVPGHPKTAETSTAAEAEASTTMQVGAVGDEAAGPRAGVEDKRSSGRRARVIAGVAAVVLAGGGGLAGYEVVARRPVKVTDSTGRLSVEAPRSWSQKAVNGWTPPGGSVQPGLLVSRDAEAWQSPSGAPGVFVGVSPDTTLPTTVAAPSDCTARPGAPDRSPVDDKTAVTFWFACSGGTAVAQRFVRVAQQESLRIQVRADSDEQAEDVLGSATYRPD